MNMTSLTYNPETKQLSHKGKTYTVHCIAKVHPTKEFYSGWAHDSHGTKYHVQWSYDTDSELDWKIPTALVKIGKGGSVTLLYPVK